MSSDIGRKDEIANESIPTVGFLRLPHILALIPVCKSSIWAWVANGAFPKPCKLGPRTTAWKAAEIYEWIQSREKKNGDT